MIAKNTILTLLICLLGISPAQAQDKLLSNKKLKRQQTYTNLEEALANPSAVYKLKLGGKENMLKEIPAEVFQFKNLQELDLSANRLSGIPNELFTLTNLQRLDISFNEISEIPAGIKQLTNLKVFVGTGCRLVTLPAEMGQLQNLEEIDLFANHIKTLPPEMAKLTNLKKINLIKTGITPEELQKIKVMLPNVEFVGI